MRPGDAPVADLRGLKAMTGLLSPDVSGNEIVDLSPLAGLTRLTLLSVAATGSTTFRRCRTWRP